MINLSKELARRNCRIDFIANQFEGPLQQLIPSDIRTFEFKKSHPPKILPFMIRYLKEQKPDVLLTVKGYGKEAYLARKAADIPAKLSLVVGTTVTQKSKNANFFKRVNIFREMRKYCRKADIIIAVSKGVAQDISQITGILPKQIKVVNNPTVTPELASLAQENLNHPWFGDTDVPVVISVGRLCRAKDFTTLLRAFALVRKQRRAKLIIFGEGRKRGKLASLARKLRIDEDVALPGFAINPYKFVAKADLFVLSSLWEGSPNALIEALALGTPVVSTNCKSGPQEILQNGAYGPLVPVADAGALAQAISATLDDHLDPDTLKLAVQPYTLENSVIQHIQALGLDEEQSF